MSASVRESCERATAMVARLIIRAALTIAFGLLVRVYISLRTISQTTPPYLLRSPWGLGLFLNSAMISDPALFCA